MGYLRRLGSLGKPGVLDVPANPTGLRKLGIVSELGSLQISCQTIPQIIIFIWHETIFEKIQRLYLTIKDQMI